MIRELLAERGVPPAAPGQAEDWPARRAAYLDTFARLEYGVAPPPPARVRADRAEIEKRAWAGKADHLRCTLSFQAPLGEFSFPVDLVLPIANRPRPLVIYPSFERYPIGKYGPIEEIVDEGYGLAAFCYNDVATDGDDGFSTGLAAMYPRDPDDGAAWGKIAMWAFAASRVMDWVWTVEGVDAGRIYCAGHSRLGKTALWCAGQDERFAGVFANMSGCSGAAITRDKRGERVRDICERFPYWFCPDYRQYAGREREMPFEQNQLLALIAPRPLYVADAVEDIWCDPDSEYLSCASAGDAYMLLGGRGFVAPDALPQAGLVLHGGDIGYHLRAGTHFLSRYDWVQALRFFSAAGAGR
ncbi:MAG: acetylxylan esterase [Clostridiales bacterium]|nr:acetylxylan esterase [Clostridiales bacterium]